MYNLVPEDLTINRDCSCIGVDMISYNTIVV